MIGPMWLVERVFSDGRRDTVATCYTFENGRRAFNAADPKAGEQIEHWFSWPANDQTERIEVKWRES